MAINKRFAHLNHSGSNHSILDAESAYITGTLQVGPAVPALGSDVNFFVSGAKDGEGGLVPAVGVFGGDLVVSGNLHFLGGLTGSIPGVEAYWSSPSLGVIKAETSSSMVEVPFLSSSNGAEISGSTTFNVIGNTAYSVVISGTNTFGQAPAFQVVSTGFVPGTVFSINGDSGTTQVENNYDQLLNPEPGFAYAILDAGRIKTAWSGSSVSIKADQGNPAEIELITSGGTGFTNAIIRSTDEGANPIDLDLRIRALQINGDPGIAGYALTSSGPGVAPGWAPIATPSIASDYWFSSGSNEIATTGSVALVGGDYPTKDKASDYGSDVFFYVSGTATTNGYRKSVFGGTTFTSGNIQLAFDSKLQSRNSASNDFANILQLGDASGLGYGNNVVVFGDSSQTSGFAFLDPGGPAPVGIIALITGSNEGYFSGSYKFPQGITGSITKLTDGSDYLLAGTGITLTTQSNGAVTISATLATGKQFLASATTTTTTTPLMIGQFSWVPADYTGLTSVRVRAIMSTDGTANHTGSLQIYNLTSGSYLDLIDTPSTNKYFTVTGSTPTLVTSSNLLTGITNFDNSSTSVYEVRVSGSTANNTIIGGVELIFS